ncbi:hypothetical protein P280DRAFT_518447 [Massarina eburnea CBS 473.64]|uniref:Uncharacterized protein n=1 Tax=Massarina eburnea CBS 473.64 TaxID=1395130 RepID=A0A6A6RWT5_9PLEO|nr:hypothetical protein P280DRAFT_518447 [Massarina eburnea CBS 473.64]
MIFTGIILLPTAVPYAVQDLQDLKTVIDSATATIDAAPNNSTWGFFNPAAPQGAMGTADLVTNITTSVLRAQYLLNVDPIAWTTPPNTTNGTTNPLPPNPTIPTDGSMTTVLTETTSAPPLLSSLPDPSNISLDDPYLDYILSVPNLATALTKLGRAWHKELNKPVWEAIDALQTTITSFSSSLLSANLTHSQAVLRTIRASSSLEDAKGAWSRLLNIPGMKNSAKRHVEGKKPAPMGDFYTHEELWGRDEGHGTETEGVDEGLVLDVATIKLEEVRARARREARRFVA